MFVNQEQIQKAGKDNLEAAMVVAGAQLGALQKLASLNMDAIRGGFDAWASNLRALSGARDAQELLQIQSSFIQPGLQSAAEYWQRVYGLATEAQGEVAKIAERRFAETSSALAKAKKAA